MRDTIRKSANRYSKRIPKNIARVQSAADLRKLQALDALRNNICPTCGGPVRQNLSLTGWVQCAQFGAPAFRMNPLRAACPWRIAAGHLQALDALRNNICPTCGGPVRQNLSLTGWVQCAQFGAPAFRMNPLRAACPWQGFTV